MFRKAYVLVGNVAAIGWFLSHRIPFWILPILLTPALLFCRLRRPAGSLMFLNGAFAAVGCFLASKLVSAGVFEGTGLWSLILLSVAVGLFAWGIPGKELKRVSGWWSVAFALSLVVVILATVPSLRPTEVFRIKTNLVDALIFCLLLFGEPLSLGQEYRFAPLTVCLLLLPFSLFSALVLGVNGMQIAEYPYVSVLAGVSINAFRHAESFVLCLYYGMGVFRVAYFFSELEKKHCKQKKIIV